MPGNYFDSSKSMGKREDGSEKGLGFLGPMKRGDGDISTEISMGINIKGKEVEVPLMVPGLDKKEINYLLNTPPDSPRFFDDMPKTLIPKAVEHANMRIKMGKSPFKERDEEFE